jgi:hypothetical protein
MVARVLLVIFMVCISIASCSPRARQSVPESASAQGLTVDPVTGIPYALTFQFPVAGFDTADFGFGFGAENDAFCEAYSGSACTSYGHHLGRDTLVPKTPVGTAVLAPADGIVRITTNQTFGGYGSDDAANANYRGCVVVLEHEFAGGSRFTTLLGHLKCESGQGYDAVAHVGNPPVGTLVHRGDYVAHVNHYWSGATQTIDWHHLHWGMRRGAFAASNLDAYVRGYAPKSEFIFDSSTNTWTHPDWMDPFVIVAANSDPALAAASGVLHHPSGSLLEDGAGAYWLVVDDAHVGQVAPDVVASDRYTPEFAVRVSDDELACYGKASAIQLRGHVTLYQRPGSSTVVMAYDSTHTRYDVIRLEALLSWGYDGSSLTANAAIIQNIENAYAPMGFRLLRPGALVKADEQSEVAIVTQQQTRLPIASADVFESLGFAWEHVYSIPLQVLDQVAGPRESTLLDDAAIRSCAMPPSCPTQGACGGGGPDMSDAGSAMTQLHLVYHGPASPGFVTLSAWWRLPNTTTRTWGLVPDCVDTSSGDGVLDCVFSVASGSAPFEFQVTLPDGRFWGDESCSAQGGCNSTMGSLTLSGPGGSLVVTLVANGQGPQYFNGHVAVIP